MKLYIKNILIFGLALGMTSCVETMKDGDMSTGFLGVPVLDADIQVEEFGATKAAPSLPKLSAPDASDLHFKVTDSKSDVAWDKDGLWTSPLQMPVGSYTIEVNYGSNTYRNPWYTGTYTGTISAVTEAAPAIGLRLCNSLLAVVLSDGFKDHFTPSEGNCVTITSTSGSTSTTLGNYVFVPSGENLTIQVAGKSSTDVNKTLEWTLAPLSAATATYVTCSLTTTEADAPKIKLDGTPEAWGTVGYIPVATTYNISEKNVEKMDYIAEDTEDPSSKIPGTVEGTEVVFKNLIPGKSYSVYAKIGALKSSQVEMTVATPEISISTGANHTTNSSSELDGTDFTASISIPEKFKGVVEAVNLTLWDGTAELRGKELNATETVWNSDGSEEKSWPYLPKGSYTLKGTVSYNNESANADFTGPELSSPAPTFSIVSQPIIYTSYSVYASPNAIDGISGGATGANTLDGSSIYIKKGKVSIADAILSNENYSGKIKYSYSAGSTPLNEGQNSNMKWAEHIVKSSFTFDNVNKDFESVRCHVTGLPYKNDLQTDISGWKGKANLSIKGGLTISSDAKYAISPEFHIPSDIPITFSYDVHNNGAASSTQKFCRGTVLNQSSPVNENDSSTPAPAQWTSQSTSKYTFNVSDYHCIFFYAPNQIRYNVYIRNLVIQYR